MRARRAVRLGALGAMLCFVVAPAQAGAPAPVVSHPTGSALSAPLSDMPMAHWAQAPNETKVVPRPRSLPPRAAGRGGLGPGDKVLQKVPGAHGRISPKSSFGGIGANGYIPPDPNIAVGKTDIVQLVNSEMAVFSKTGTLVSGPVSLSSLWSALGGDCATNNAGDPIVQYDLAADRWLVSQLGSASGPNYSECIAVSQSNNPSGAYYLYSYSFGGNLNDYPKFGVWPTATNPAYLATYNMYSGGQTLIGANLCAYDRNAMLSGAAAPTQICLMVSNDAGFLPSDVDGATAPADGTPGYFLNFETLSSLRLYELSPDFASPNASTLSVVTPDIAVNSFSEACNGGTCIPQPNSQKLDSLGDRLMYRLAYRIFPSGTGGVDHAAMVVNHSVGAGSSVGVRWYELRQPGGSGAFSLYQQGTFAPDGAFRWMGSAAMDGAGDIVLGYSESSGGVYPEIALTGRTPSLAAGAMGAETILKSGSGAQTTYSRWGDYSALRIDPSDDKTFWYTNEYYSQNSPFFNFLWSTAIGSFTVGSGGTTPDFTLAVAPTSLTVSRGGASQSATVTATEVNSSSAVNLSISGIPKSTSASFSPNPVTTTGSSTLTIKAGRLAHTGTYTLTVTGRNGTATHQTQLKLTIQ
jgi:hypothetical protein